MNAESTIPPITSSTIESPFAMYFNQQMPISQFQQKSPVDILRRVFPSRRRIEIELALQRCKGDVLQAIEVMVRIASAPIIFRPFSALSDITYNNWNNSSDEFGLGGKFSSGFRIFAFGLSMFTVPTRVRSAFESTIPVGAVCRYRLPSDSDPTTRWLSAKYLVTSFDTYVVDGQRYLFEQFVP